MIRDMLKITLNIPDNEPENNANSSILRDNAESITGILTVSETSEVLFDLI